MKTVKDTVEVVLNVRKDEILMKKYTPVTSVSAKLKALDKQKGLEYRNRFYNCMTLGKYNTNVVAGIKCVNVYHPRREDTGVASIEITFNIVEA